MELHHSVKDVDVELLDKVKAAILKEPRRIAMNHWLMTESDMERLLSDGQRPPCNTVGCIAGWASVLAAPSHEHEELLRQYPHGMAAEGRRVLNLSPEQTTILFYPDEWPTDFQEQLEDKTPGTLAYAQVVVDRIDHFLATGE